MVHLHPNNTRQPLPGCQQQQQQHQPLVEPAPEDPLVQQEVHDEAQQLELEGEGQQHHASAHMLPCI